MRAALEFINVQQQYKKNSAEFEFQLSSALADHILNRIDIISGQLINQSACWLLTSIIKTT